MPSPATKAPTAATTQTKATCQISHPPASTQTLKRTCTPPAPRVRGGFLPPCTSVVALTGACCPLQVVFQHTLNSKPLILTHAQNPLNLGTWRTKPPGVPPDQRRLLPCLLQLLRLLVRLDMNLFSEPTSNPSPQFILGPFGPCSHWRRPKHHLPPPGQPPALALLLPPPVQPPALALLSPVWSHQPQG
jgi:hypothetical protein